MDRLSRYLTGQCLQVLMGLCALALGVLLLERLPRIFDLVANTSDSLSAVGRMILDITPHHLTEAIPLALFLGILITVDRISRTGELSACLASGVSLTQVVKPFLAIAALMAVVSLLLTGYIRPMAQYDFARIKNDVRQRSVEAAFQEGKFAQIGDRVVWTQDRAGGRALGQIFIFERERPGIDARLTTAERGAIEPGAELNETRVSLIEGRAITFTRDRDIMERLAFARTDWNVGGQGAPFRDRGLDEWELTLPEMASAMEGGAEVTSEVAAANFHAQIGRAALLLVFPFIALPLGLGYGRRFASTGMAVGIVFLLVVQKTLQSGQSMAEAGAIPGWAGTWPVVGVIALIGTWLFLRSALTIAQPPLQAVDTGLIAPLGRALSILIAPFKRKRPAAGAGAQAG